MLSQQQGELEWQRGRRPRGPARDVAMSLHKAALTGRVDKTQALEFKKIKKKSRILVSEGCSVFLTGHARNPRSRAFSAYCPLVKTAHVVRL